MNCVRMIAALLLAGVLFAALLFAAGNDPRLTQAVKNGDAGAVRSLLKNGADVNAAEADGTTALHWAADSENLEIVNLLLAAGAKATAATRYKITPLSLAAERGNAPIIERLL